MNTTISNMGIVRVGVTWGLIIALPLFGAAGCRTSHQTEATPTVSASATLPSPPAKSQSVAEPPPPPPLPSLSARCREQPPQKFLIDAHTNASGSYSASERKLQRERVRQAIIYRTKQYGWATGFRDGFEAPGPAVKRSRRTKFFGIPVVLNERVIPVLACVEEEIRARCQSTPYQPSVLSGLRYKNTYFDGDVSNHLFGIAIDIDPVRNPCCHCLPPFRDSPRCAGKKTALQRMDMPGCWVEVFERFGFYWLGHDMLEDTMHFEYLGDPELAPTENAQAPAPAGGTTG